MPVVRTLAELREQCRDRCDHENSSFVSTPHLTRRINTSAARFHTKLTSRLGKEYLAGIASFSTVPGSPVIELVTSAGPPERSNVFKLSGVKIDTGGGDLRDLDGVTFDELSRRGLNVSRRGRPTKYARINFRKAVPEIFLSPTPDGVYTVQVFYVPNFVPLVADADELVLPEDWFDWIVCDVAIGMVVKEEGSTYRELVAERKVIDDSIATSATDIDHSHPHQWHDESRGGGTYYDDEPEDWRR